MMNRRADGENGSTAKSPTQDAVTGQISFYSLLRYSYHKSVWIPLEHKSTYKIKNQLAQDQC